MSTEKVTPSLGTMKPTTYKQNEIIPGILVSQTAAASHFKITPSKRNVSDEVKLDFNYSMTSCSFILRSCSVTDRLSFTLLYT